MTIILAISIIIVGKTLFMDFLCLKLTASCEDWDVRLEIDDYYEAAVDSQYGNLYIKDELAAGHVEVCLEGSYGPVCLDDQFRLSQSATVICSQLGFSRYG